MSVGKVLCVLRASLLLSCRDSSTRSRDEQAGAEPSIEKASQRSASAVHQGQSSSASRVIDRELGKNPPILPDEGGFPGFRRT